MAEPDTPILAGDNLTCVRGGRTLFSDLSFALPAGAGLVLRGPNGSGKSSLLRILAGVLVPKSGRVLWHGLETGDDPAPWRRALVFVGHRNGIKSVLSVRENLAFWARMAGCSGDDTAQALAAFGLDRLADLPAGMLSAGQQRRLALCRLALRPVGCWLLDEPAAALDNESSVRLADLAARHRERGGVTVTATHDDAAAAEGEEILDLGALP